MLNKSLNYDTQNVHSGFSVPTGPTGPTGE